MGFDSGSSDGSDRWTYGLTLLCLLVKILDRLLHRRVFMILHIPLRPPAHPRAAFLLSIHHHAIAGDSSIDNQQTVFVFIDVFVRMDARF